MQDLICDAISLAVWQLQPSRTDGATICRVWIHLDT